MNWLIVGTWVGVLALSIAVVTYVENRAALRGAHRTPMSAWTDKGLRLLFYLTLTAPMVVTWPWYTAPIVLLYLPTFIDGSEKHGRPSNLLKGASIWKLFKWYFSLNLVTDVPGFKLNPKQQYILGMHPHGFLPFGTVVNTSTNASGMPAILNGVELRTLAASFCFFIPGYRDLILGGGVIDAARFNARAALDSGKSLSLVPGGATEGLYAMPGNHTLVLRKRRGFIKLALETGAHLVPCFSFGENNCYNQMSAKWPVLKKIQAKWQRITGLSLPLVTNIIPKRSVITTVIGQPIPVKKVEKPSDAEVEALLEVYIAKLQDLFQRNAVKYIPDPTVRGLTII